MNRGQEIDQAYQEQKLLVLLARRQKLPATSDQLPELDVQILAVWNLVRSYRLVQAHHISRQALEPAETSPIDSLLGLLPETLRLEMLEAKRKRSGPNLR
jgi:hypothetical protein